MSKDKISDYSATANSNTDIGGINIDEGCAPSGINDAIRTLMKQLKDFQQGTNSDSFNGPVGATTRSTGAFTSLSTTGDITIDNGSADGGQLLLASSGYSNWGIDNYSGNFRWYYNTTEMMRLNSSGNLGLGVTPSAWSTYKALQVGGAAVSEASGSAQFSSNYYRGASNDIYINTNYALLYRQVAGAGQHQWFTAPSGTAGNAITFTQAMTLNSSGSLSVGGTNADGTRGSFYGTTTALDSGGQLFVGVTDAIAADKGGQIMMGAYYTGTTMTSMGGIAAKRENGSSGNYAGYLQFITSTNGSGNTEKARIDSSGNLLVGATATTSNARLAVTTSSTSNLDYGIYAKNSGGAFLLGIDNNGGFSTGTAAGSPYNATTATAANTVVDSAGALKRSTSSLKYKTDVHDATHGLVDLLKLRSVTYKGKNDGDTIFGGLIAEEVHEAGLTEFVQYAEDGSPDALAYGNMVSLCIKAIQEQQAIIETLTNRITALEQA